MRPQTQYICHHPNNPTMQANLKNHPRPPQNKDLTNGNPDTPQRQ